MLYLLLLQIAGLTGLLIMVGMGVGVDQASRLPAAVVLGVLLGIALILLENRIRLSLRLAQMRADLKRAAKGNLNTRLLTNGEPLLDELVFAINELVQLLADHQIRSLRSEAARKRLLANISHDIRTPLTSIIGYVDALRDHIPESEAERQEYISVVSRKAGALKELIDEIFHMAKLDADEVPLHLESLDLAEMAREAAIEFLPELKQRQIVLEAELPETACWIEADRLSLQRIIRNLIKNALQYGQGGGVLGITLSDLPDAYQLIIWDKGPGIAAHDLPHLFERLYRADQSRNRAGGGSGLGLSIAKALMEKHGGEIRMESEPWIETRVYLTFYRDSVTVKSLLRTR